MPLSKLRILVTPLETMADFYISLSGLNLNIYCVLPLDIPDVGHVYFCTSCVYMLVVCIQFLYDLSDTPLTLKPYFSMVLILLSEGQE